MRFHSFISITAAMFLPISTAASAQEADAEPPLEVVLEIDGQKFDAAVGESAEVTIDGKTRSLKLTAKPTRRFAKAGIEFRYPSYFTYELDDSIPGIRIYTVEGPTTMVMLQNFNAGELTADAAAASLLEELRRLYGDSLAGVTKTEMTLGGKKVAGQRATAIFAEQRLQQEVYPIHGTSSIIMVQTLPTEDDAAQAEETKLVLRLLAETFKVVKRKPSQ